MKKRILATILCVLMLVPCFVLLANAVKGDVTPWDIESDNVAPKGKTYHSSIWNADSTSRYINNGQNYSSWQMWRPGDPSRQGQEGLDNTLQYAGLSFNYYQSANSITIYGMKYGDFDGAFCGKCMKKMGHDGYNVNYKKNNKGEIQYNNGEPIVDTRTCKTCGTKVTIVSNQRNNIKYTIKVLVQGQWIEAGHGYNNDMEYAPNANGEIPGEDLGVITINFDKVFPQYDKNGDVILDSNGEVVYTDYATTKNIRVECTEYGSYGLRGTTNEISFVYSADNKVTHVNYMGVKYEVTEDTSASIPTYKTMKDGLPLVFTANEKLGAAEFPVVQAEHFVESGEYDENGDPIYYGGDRFRYFFEYDADGKIVITQKLASTHDWWLVPIIHEVEIWGHQAVTTPKFDVPEGAEVVSNAALGGMASATTSATGYYPLLGNDRATNTSWRANDYENQSYWIDFDKDYLVKDVKLNFGGLSATIAGSEYAYDVFIKKNGEWQKLASDTVTAESDVWNDSDLKTYEVDASERIGGVKITFTSSKKDGENINPAITEVAATIANGEQCIFLSSYLNFYRASSTAQGNLACYGTAYCSSSFDYSNISDVTFINDGQTADDAYSWYAQSFLRGTYCGIQLKDTEDITKVVLYFNDQITQGKPEEHVIEFEVQALVNGQYVTVAKATSYDVATKKAIVSVTLDEPVRTNDIRIVYVSNGLVFPYLKELEIYSGEMVYGAYQGYVLDTSMRTLHGRYPTMDFAEKSIVKRAKYMDLVAPIEILVFATKYGIDA